MNPVKNLNLFSQVKYYRKLSEEIQSVLLKHPDDWSKFQQIFNLCVDRVYQDITLFEKENAESEMQIYKLKKIFEKRYRQYFLYGDFIRWSFQKPYGYAGDFKIIDDIYLNQPTTTGFDRLWDNYFQQLAASCATRERKEDFKKIIVDFVKNHKTKNVRIMNMASGPAREIKELLDADNEGLFSNTVFDCYDLDERALEYARRLINRPDKVNFIQKNAIRIALKKDITLEIYPNYDLIYCTGLFDYLDKRIAVRLVSNLKKLVKRNGLLVVANVADKYNNPSASWMEWVAEWYLIYRTELEFKNIFLEAGFTEQNLHCILQKSGVMQYCICLC